MKTPHKHAELIKAWANGAEIEVRNNHSEESWEETTLPMWRDYFEYRIKPEPRPDVVQYCRTDRVGWNNVNPHPCADDNLKLTFDGETGKLIKAEVI